MDLHELSFAKIIILRDDIAEVMINDGIEMNPGMVDQYHDFLLSHLRSPFALLINKVNAYTYSFEAQQKLASFPRDEDWNISIFPDHDQALGWLISEQENLSNLK